MSELRDITTAWMNGFSYSRHLTLNQMESVVFWPYWSDLCQVAAAYCKTVNCIVKYPESVLMQACIEPAHGFHVGEFVYIDGREGKYKISSFNTKDFDEPRASVRAGCSGEWVAVSRLRRVEE